METGKHITPYKAPGSDQKIAVVGGGAEGLTLSYYLARLGYKPTIFEAKPQLGGILRYVIAEDRLPRKVLDHEIVGILQIGVQTKNNVVMGRDFQVESLLRDGFDAIAVTKGGFDSRQVLQPDQNDYDSSISGVYTMLDFLYILSKEKSIDLGQRVVIIHNGRESLDLARRCINMGAERVPIVSSPVVHALPLELQDKKGLAAEGIFIRPQTVVTALKGISRRLIRVALEDIHPIGQIPKERETIRADTLIVAAGRLPEFIFVKSEDQSEAQEEEIVWETIEAFRTFPGDKDGICTPPEPGRISDSSAVVKSLLSGRRLTRAIHQHFSTDSVTPIQGLVCEADSILNVTEVHDVISSNRERPHIIDVEGNSKTAWIFPDEYPGLDEASSRKEAERCLKCGLICYRKQK